MVRSLTIRFRTQSLARALTDRLRPRYDAMAKDPPMDDLTVAQLLELSRAAHLQYRYALDHGDKTAAVDPFVVAAVLQAQAELRDPDHLDPAWIDNGGTHATGPDTFEAMNEDMLQYYHEQLEKIPRPAPSVASSGSE